MRINYPLSLPVARESLAWAESAGYRAWYQDVERGLHWIAPRWLAWLYRWLPGSVFVQIGAKYDRPAGPGAYYLWSLSGSRWHVAYLPLRRADTAYASLAGRKARWGYLSFGGPKMVAL